MQLDKALATQLLTAHPTVAAAALESMPTDVVLSVLADLAPAAAALVLTQMAPHRGSEVLGRMESSVAEPVLDHLGFDAAANLIRRLPLPDRSRFVRSLVPASAEALQTLLDYPKGTAGAFMDSRALALPEDVTVGDAVSQIRKSPDHVRDDLYVVDRGRRLVGVLNLRELLLADRKQKLVSVARTDVRSIPVDATRPAVLAHPAWREAPSLPVVDHAGTYLGAIGYQTRRLLEEEASTARRRHDTTTADAIADLFATGVAGAVGALTDLGSRATTVESPDGER